MLKCFIINKHRCLRLCSHKGILHNWCTHEVRHNNEVERLLIRLITAALTNSANSVKWAIYLQKQVVCSINYVLNYNKGTGTLMCTTTIMEKLHADHHNEFHLRLSTYHVMVLKKTNDQDTGGFLKLSAIKLHLHLCICNKIIRSKGFKSNIRPRLPTIPKTSYYYLLTIHHSRFFFAGYSVKQN